MSDLERASAEIQALHAFFVDWLTGGVPKEGERLSAGIVERLDPSFVIVQPGGQELSGETIAAGIRSAHGLSPGFRIAIRNVRVLRRIGDVLLVLYEEWQVNARNSSPPDNGRLSTVIFRDRGDRLVWLHVHETWLPEEVMRAGPYDF